MFGIEFPLAFGSMPEMLMLGALAVLIFGKQLPEVGRTVGRSLMEFRKGLGDLKDIHSLADLAKLPVGETARPARSTYNELDDREEATAPKFEPPRAEPKKSAPTG